MTDRYQPLRDAIAVLDNPPAMKRGRLLSVDENMNARIAWDDPRDDFHLAADPDTIAALLKERDALREALQWYASMSKRMGNASIAGDSQAILTLMKDVAVDYGGRARAALADGEASNGS